LQWKEPLPRAVPNLSNTLSELHNYGITLEGRDSWRRRIFYKIAAFVLEPEQGRLVAKGTAWQNEAMTIGYLQGRESLAFFSNVSYLFESDPSATDGVLRAAVLAHRALQFHDDLAQGRLAPEIEGSQRLDQSQYPNFFGTSRVPGQDQDQMQYTADSGHFMVSCRGQFFRVDIPSEPTSVEDLYATFVTIEAQAKPTSDSFGLLTSLSRIEWGQWRQRMMLDEQNSAAIKALDSALFLIALDLDAAPADRTEAMANLAFGHLENRWFDKSHQIVVTSNGIAGINRDHSFLDGHPTLKYAQYLTDATLPTAPDRGTPLPTARLEFRRSQELNDAITAAKTAFSQIRANFRLVTWDSDRLGGDLCKARGYSADFLVQAAIHLACYSIFGKCSSISEAVHMRHTVAGRYDSVITLTPAMRELVKKFATSDQVTRVDLLKNGQLQHKARIRKCKEGGSPILHLSALLSQPVSRGPFRLTGDGLYLGQKWKLCNADWQQIMRCPVTTSHPGYLRGIECTGFTDTYPSVLGVSYLVKGAVTTFYLKADHQVLPLGKRMQEALNGALAEIGEAIGENTAVRFPIPDAG